MVLRERGHDVTLATHETYRDRVECHGLRFHAVPPDLTDFGDQAELMRRVMAQRTGSEFVVRRLVLPHLVPAYRALERACEGADLLVSHPITYAAPVLAEKKGLAWASAVLQPLVLFSASDPSVPPQAPWFERLRPLGRGFFHAYLSLVRAITRPWMEPVESLRRSLGLPASVRHPMLEGQFAPRLNLALFSEAFAAPQADWPAHTVVTGFPFYERDRMDEEGARALRSYLDRGEAPIVFTLGSSAVQDAGCFFRESVAAARRLGRRAVLLVGQGTASLPDSLPAEALVLEYAPHGLLFPHASAIVHSGGAGTIGQALRSGRPMLVVPYSHDQPDHAARIVRLGVGRSIPRQAYRSERAATELTRLLDDPAYARRAAALGERVRAERGAERAADALEELLGTTGTGSSRATVSA